MTGSYINITLLSPELCKSMFTLEMCKEIIAMSGCSEGNVNYSAFEIVFDQTKWDHSQLLEYSENHNVIFKVFEDNMDLNDKRVVYYYHGKCQRINVEEFHEEYAVPWGYAEPDMIQLFGWSSARFFCVDDINPIPVVKDEVFIAVSEDLKNIVLAHYDLRSGWGTEFDVKYWKRINQ